MATAARYQKALGRITSRAVIPGIDSDRPYPVGLRDLLATSIPRAGDVQVIESLYGHVDDFFIETARSPRSRPSSTGFPGPIQRPEPIPST